MKVLHINILDKKATYMHRDGDIVCGNSDYVIEFAFDAEWAAHDEKIARFVWNEAYKDVTFTGTTCPVPIITNATEVEVGVYAGELCTTTPALIGCQKSILCQSSIPGGIPFTKGEKGDRGEGVPPVTDADNGKVLTAKEDGTTEWKEAQGGAEAIVVENLDALPDDAEDGTIAVIPNGEMPSGGGGGANIITVDSITDLPKNAPDGTIAAVVAKEIDTNFKEYYKKAFYNDCLLADINELWLIDSYQYYVIFESTGYNSKELCLFTKRPYIDKYGRIVSDGAVRVFVGNKTGWHDRSGNNNTYDTSAVPLWTSVDILNPDGSVKYVGTEPIEVLSSDIFIRRNGKWYMRDSANDVANIYTDQTYGMFNDKFDGCWRDTGAFDVSQAIILGQALQSPGGTVTIPDSYVQEALGVSLYQLVYALSIMPVTLRFGIDGTSTIDIRIVAQVVGEYALFTTFFPSEGEVFMLTLQITPNEFTYTVLTTGFTPLVPAD